MEIESLPSKRAGVERVRFNKIVYRRYPNSKNESDRKYFRCGKGDVRRGYGYLHRDVWVYHHGWIPESYHVHHRDGDPGNNRLANLEVLTPEEHSRRHPFTPARLEGLRENLDAARVKASEWHRSAEGREWHREHGREVWRNRAEHERICGHCGKKYRTKVTGKQPKYCSLNCRAYARRKRGDDVEERACITCGQSFRINKYSPTKNCSRKCAMQGRRRQEERTCLYCGGIFVARLCVVKRYCCLECAYADRRRKTATRLQPES